MAYCTRCGAENPDASRYCAKCGANLHGDGPAGTGQPQYVPNPNETARSENLAAQTGLILGIISIVIVWVPGISWISLITSIVGLVLGSKSRTGPNAGTAGRVLNIIALVIWVIAVALVAIGFGYLMVSS